MTWRRLEPDDHRVVRRILLAAYIEHLSVENDYADLLVDLTKREADSEVWVLTDDDVVVATVTLCPPGSTYREIAVDGEGEFRMLGVDPARQGEGIGRRVTEHVIDELRGRGLDAVVLSTSLTMTAAKALYESLGFVRLPERDWSPVPSISLLAYRLDLR